MLGPEIAPITLEISPVDELIWKPAGGSINAYVAYEITPDPELSVYETVAIIPCSKIPASTSLTSIFIVAGTSKIVSSNAFSFTAIPFVLATPTSIENVPTPIVLLALL